MDFGARMQAAQAAASKSDDAHVVEAAWVQKRLSETVPHFIRMIHDALVWASERSTALLPLYAVTGEKHRFLGRGIVVGDEPGVSPGLLFTLYQDKVHFARKVHLDQRSGLKKALRREAARTEAVALGDELLTTSELFQIQRFDPYNPSPRDARKGDLVLIGDWNSDHGYVGLGKGWRVGSSADAYLDSLLAALAQEFPETPE